MATLVDLAFDPKERAMIATAKAGVDVPAMRAEAAALLAGLGSGRVVVFDDVAALLGRLALSFPVRDRTAQQWALVFEDYTTDFADVDVDDLNGACGLWRRSGNAFFPTSGELLAHCTTARGRREYWLRALQAIAAFKVAASEPAAGTLGEIDIQAELQKARDRVRAGTAAAIRPLCDERTAPCQA